MTSLLILSRAIHFGSCLLLLGFIAVRLLVESPAATDLSASRRLSACAWFAFRCGRIRIPLAMGSYRGYERLWLLESLTRPLSGWSSPKPRRARYGSFAAFWLPLSSAPGLFPSPLDMDRCRNSAAALVTSLAWLGHAGASAMGTVHGCWRVTWRICWRRVYGPRACCHLRCR